MKHNRAGSWAALVVALSLWATHSSRDGAAVYKEKHALGHELHVVRGYRAYIGAADEDRQCCQIWRFVAKLAIFGVAR